MQIKKLPICERPYEKLEIYGEQNLSNAELLAIIIKAGTKDKTSVELAQEILNIISNMRELTNISINELTKIKGIGKVKAIQIKAVCELSKRLSKPLNINAIKLNSTKDVVNLLMDELKTEPKEKIKELIINSKNMLMKIIDISYGGVNFSQFSIQQILSEPIKMNAPSIILVHNHPSGDATPSKEDINITKRIYTAAKIMGIQLVDHVVIGNDSYQSIMLPIRRELEKND